MAKMMLSTVCLLLAMVSLHELSAQVQPQSATVHVVSVAWNGEDIGKVDVESFKSEEGKEFKDRFRENTARKIPYGVYALTAGLEGLLPDKKIVDVLQPEVWVVVQPWLTVGDTVGYGPDFVVKGVVKNVPPSDAPLYVRLVGVYRAYSGDTKVQISGNNGTFTLSAGVPDGRYVLITTGRNGVLDMRPVNNGTALLPPIEIDLTRRSKDFGDRDSK